MSGMLFMDDNGLIPDCWLHLDWMGPLILSRSTAFTARIEHPEYGRGTVMVGRLNSGDEFTRVDLDRHDSSPAYTGMVRDPFEVAAIVAAATPLPKIDAPGHSWERERVWIFMTGTVVGFGAAAAIAIFVAGLAVL